MIIKSRLTWGALLLLTALSGSGCNNTTTTPDAAAALTAAGITLSKDPLTFTDVTSTSLTVNWAAAKSSTVAASKILYQVFYTEVDPGSIKPTVASIKASGWTLAGHAVANITSMALTALSPSTTYYLTVIASDGGTHTAVYPVTAQTTGFTLADATLTASAITGTGLTLNWTAASDDATLAAKISYNVYYSPLATLTTVADWTNAAKATAVGSAATAITTKDISGLSINTTYYFMVIASDPTGNSALYDSLTETTTNVDTTAPVPGGSSTPAVATLSFTGANTTGFTVDWAAATDDISKPSTLIYEVFYATAASSFLSTTALDAAVKAYSATSLGKGTGIVTLVVTALPSNTSYNVGVMVTDEAGNRALYASGTIATTAVVVADPTAPTVSSGTLTASSITTTGLTLSWTAATDNVSAQSALQYLVYYTNEAPSSFDSITHIKAVGTAVGTFTAAITTKSITGLTAGTTYQFQVLVRDEAGNDSKYTTKQQATNGTYIYMYTYGIPNNGNLGGRSGADDMCWGSGAKPSSCSTQANTHAFLTVSSSDYLSTDHFATTSSTQPPSTSTIVNGTNSYQIAPNWNSLLTAGPCQSGSSNSTCSGTSLAAVLGSSIWPWIGSFGSTCQGWTSSASIDNGTTGYFVNSADADFISNGPKYCDSSSLYGITQSLICVCW